MTTKTLEKTVRKLSREVASLRSFFVESVNNEDLEGEYKPAFVRKVLKSAQLKASLGYNGKGSLLRQIRTV